MASDTLSILDGSTFIVSDRAGDIDAGIDTPHGLFYRDTRFLSRWRLRVDGRALEVLSTDDCGFAPFGDDTSTARETAFAKIRARVVGTDLAAQRLGVA